MSSPTSCTRCSKLQALLSPGGLCRECAASDATAEATPARPLASGDSFSPTVTNVPAAPGAAPATRTAADGIGDLSGPRRALPEPPPGYELIRRLGGGGMGDVYLAREQPSERLVAIKFLRSPEHADGFRRFVIELQALAKLDHPHIVRVFASDFLRATPFFTMEYLEGGPLSRAVESATTPVAEAVRIIRTVAVAVAAAHACKVIHRDLKPSNILLTRDGTPKVADFGLAKQLDADEDFTRSTAAIGTPGYMPPEQVSKRNGPIGAWSDVYGLGATLYHVLTGRAPFVGESSAEIISQVLKDPPVRPRAVRGDLPPELEGVVLKCLEKVPANRYQTVADLIADLDRFTAGQTPVALPLTRRRRAVRWVKRNRFGVGAAALALLVVVGAFALGGALWRKPPEKPRDHLAEYQRELKAGKPVTLIPAKGRPAWSEQAIGGIEFSTPVAIDESCALAAVDHGLLLLLREVGLTRYSVEAELCELRPAGARPGLDQYQWCGLVVGYDVNPLPTGGRMHSFFSTTFRDYPIATVVGQPQVPEHAKFGAAGLIELPNENPMPVLGNARYRIPFTASPRLPGNWRKVKIVVLPDRVQAFWWTAVQENGIDVQPPRGDWALFADLDAEQIRERISHTQNTLTRNRPNLGRQFPDWAPQKGIGIWCAKGSFGVRNVVVTPLKDD